jgi:hypothetical protein
VRDQLAQARQVLRTQVGASAPPGTGEAGA